MLRISKNKLWIIEFASMIWPANPKLHIMQFIDKQILDDSRSRFSGQGHVFRTEKKGCRFRARRAGKKRFFPGPEFFFHFSATEKFEVYTGFGGGRGISLFPDKIPFPGPEWPGVY